LIKKASKKHCDLSELMLKSRLIDTNNNNRITMTIKKARRAALQRTDPMPKQIWSDLPADLSQYIVSIRLAQLVKEMPAPFTAEAAGQVVMALMLASKATQAAVLAYKPISLWRKLLSNQAGEDLSASVPTLLSKDRDGNTLLHHLVRLIDKRVAARDRYQRLTLSPQESRLFHAMAAGPLASAERIYGFNHVFESLRALAPDVRVKLFRQRNRQSMTPFDMALCARREVSECVYRAMNQGDEFARWGLTNFTLNYLQKTPTSRPHERLLVCHMFVAIIELFNNHQAELVEEFRLVIPREPRFWVDENGNSFLHNVLLSLSPGRFCDAIDEEKFTHAINMLAHLRLQGQVNHERQTLLHLAAKIGSFHPIRQKLLSKRINAEALDKDGNTYLHLMLPQGCAQLPVDLNDRFRASSAALLNSQNVEGETVFHRLMKSVDESESQGELARAIDASVDILLSRGVNVLLTDRQGQTLLMLALLNGHLGVAQKLLAHQPELASMRDVLGNSALHYLVDSIDIPFVAYASRRQDQGSYCFYRLDCHVSLVIQKALDELKQHLAADLLVENDRGETPVDIAMLNGSVLVGHFYIWANEAQKQNWFQSRATHEHFEAKVRPEIILMYYGIKRLMTLGYQPDLARYPFNTINQQDATGNTLLHYVAAHYRRVSGDPQVIPMLVNYLKADISIVNAEGELALHRLTARTKAEALTVVQDLLPSDLAQKQRVIEQQDREGNTPLLSASANGQYALITLLLGNGALLGAVNARGESFLHCLNAKARLPEIYRLAQQIAVLFSSKEHSPVAFFKDVRMTGETPIDAAQHRGDLYVAKVLRKVYEALRKGGTIFSPATHREALENAQLPNAPELS
jgi:ankyrin repeat protein